MIPWQQKPGRNNSTARSKIMYAPPVSHTTHHLGPGDRQSPAAIHPVSVYDTASRQRVPEKGTMAQPPLSSPKTWPPLPGKESRSRKSHLRPTGNASAFPLGTFCSGLLVLAFLEPRGPGSRPFMNGGLHSTYRRRRHVARRERGHTDPESGQSRLPKVLW